MKNIVPINDRVVIQADEAEDRSKGGIIIPDVAKDKPTTGTVVAVGPGAFIDGGGRHPMAVQVGDSVMYGKYTGQDIVVDGVTLKVLREDDVIVILPDDKSI